MKGLIKIVAVLHFVVQPVHNLQDSTVTFGYNDDPFLHDPFLRQMMKAVIPVIERMKLNATMPNITENGPKHDEMVTKPDMKISLSENKQSSSGRTMRAIYIAAILIVTMIVCFPFVTLFCIKIGPARKFGNMRYVRFFNQFSEPIESGHDDQQSYEELHSMNSEEPQSH